MKKRRLVIPTLVAVLVAVTAVVSPGTATETGSTGPTRSTESARSEQEDTIRRALDRLVTRDGLPGAQAVISDGRRTTEVESGVGDLETGRPFPHRARLRIASNTKAFTATVALQLVDEGRLDLDAKVERYLPGVVRGNGNDGREITLRQLLQQTSGLVDYGSYVTEHDRGEFEPTELLGLALEHEPRFAPGAKWEYSNTNYLLVGMIIEAVTGREIGREITDRILRPLRLRHTYWPNPLNDQHIRGPHPTPYQPKDGDHVEVEWVNASVLWATGALVSTGQDLNTFYRALISGKLLSPRTLAEMQRTVPAPLLGRGASYGLGIGRYPMSCGGSFWGHGGSVEGTRTRGGATRDGRAVNIAVNEIADAEDGSQHVVDAAAEALCATRPKADPLWRFDEQRLFWKGCARNPDDDLGRELDEHGAECADISVPLDYEKPSGRTITVAVSRIEGSGRRILLHGIGGGPGGSGIDGPLTTMPALGAELARSYDLVGFDPRFVGRSTPLHCELPGEWMKAPGADLASFRRIARYQAELAERCWDRNADVLPYVTTRNTARDMDLLRTLLDARSFDYIGTSYGTYLGLVYRSMFPDRMDRTVLDSVVDPERYPNRLLADTAPANEEYLDGLAGWIAKRDEEYGLGRTAEDVESAVRSVLSSAADRPLRIGDFRVDEHTVPGLLALALTDDTRYPEQADILRQLHRASRGEQVTPSEELAGLLAPVDENLDNALSVNIGIFCGDAAAPRDLSWYWRNIERSRGKSPMYGPLFNNVSPCAFWQERPAEEPTRIDYSGKALLLQSTGDTRTPYSGTKKVHRAMPDSRMVVLQGATHGLFGYTRNQCIEDRVRTYLGDGELPTSDVRCQRD